jgi:hypothetical protein
MAKLSSLNLVDRAGRGAVLVVRDTTQPVGEDGEHPAILAADGSPATLTLLGMDSPQARRIQYRTRAAFQSRVLARAHAAQKADGITPDDIAEQAEADLDLLVALTVDWHGFEDDDDQPIPCTPAAVRALYAASPIILEQALAFVQDRRRFFGPPSTPSAGTSSTSSA